jgi:hypothetical protein
VIFCKYGVRLSLCEASAPDTERVVPKTGAVNAAPRASDDQMREVAVRLREMESEPLLVGYGHRLRSTEPLLV